MLKLFGWISAAIGLVALGYDIYRGPVQGGQLHLAAIAEIWSQFHRPSLIGLNSFTEKRLSPEIWDVFILPALMTPAALVFIVLALFLFLGAATSKNRDGRRKKMMFPK